MLKFDDVLQYVGEFGFYQKRVYFLLCLFCISHGMRMVVMVFILHIPKHRCAISNYTQDTYDVTSYDHEIALNMSIPSLDSCHVYRPGNYTYDHYNKPVNATLEECDHWVYDTSTVVSTVASQFDLVCDSSTKRSVATMTFYGGYLIGVFVLGAVSDTIGRKLCLYLSLSLLIIFGSGLAFADSFIVFAVINFFVGASTTGIFTSVLVIGIELVGPSKRTYTGMFTHLFFSLGVVSLAGIAYLIQEWQYLQIAITAPLVLFYFMWCIIPESPRWQIQRGQYAKARATVEKVVAVNNTKVPEHVLEEVMPSQVDEEKLMLNGHTTTPPESKKPDSKERLVDLFKSRVLFVRTLIIFFNWMVVSMTFYGLNFNAGNLGVGSIYLNLFLAGLVEFPAHITTIFTVDRVGRRIVHSAMMIFSGIACLSCVFSIIYIPQDFQWATVVLAMLGKFGAAGGFGTIYLYSTEFYPTVIRNSAIGASSSCARIGAMLAPYIAAQGAERGDAFGRSIPLLVCGVLILLAGSLFLTLPETLNRKLPETIADARNFTRSQRTTDVKATVDQSSSSKSRLTLANETTEI